MTNYTKYENMNRRELLNTILQEEKKIKKLQKDFLERIDLLNYLNSKIITKFKEQKEEFINIDNSEVFTKIKNSIDKNERTFLEDEVRKEMFNV